MQIDSSAIEAGTTSPRLRWISAVDGSQIRVVPVDRVVYFQADHKYTRVVSERGELFIRMSLRDISQRLDNEQFWQVHRSAIVNIAFLEAAIREDNRIRIIMRGRSESLTVSEQYHHLFRTM